MRATLWNKRLPTLLGLLIISISIAALTFLTRSPQVFELRARTPPTAEVIETTVNSPLVPPDTSGFQREQAQPGSEETELELTTPKDGDFLIDEKPLFQGRGTPHQTIEITIESEPISAKVVADENGNFSYQPDSSLPPGTHTVSVRFLDGGRAVKVIQRQFEVFASGSQVSEPATPSPTLVVSPSPTEAPIPTKAPVPTTGTALPTLLVLSAGLFIVLAGSFMLRMY